MNSQQSSNIYPELGSDYRIEKEQYQSYLEKGHIVLRGVAIPEEAMIYRNEICDQVRKLNPHQKDLNDRDTYGKAFIQVGNLWRQSKVVEKFVLARRFAKIAADLMGVEGIRIYHDQALFKEPGGGHTPWHQDQIYWPLDTEHTITMWMPLVPISEEVGSMTFASGTHKEGPITRQVISDESHKTLSQYVTSRGYEQVNYGAMAAGDATFHSGWTAHCAPGNPTNTMREVMTIIYMADGVRVAEPDSSARKNDLLAVFPGLKPGDIAASPINPLVYHRNWDK
ncbi:phytanoyl-CoA dioxygenase family protein [Paenibacillus ginsengarvi]|uniref:Phytanoyl-CoA dioxygenase family protein n=1 Tax=Paenibacillus ginsengarvi TaxID=400777 RepID=A0A3B0CMY7_9BACL|nr:phytanoyl-CoA dioxygenase family protein [Paenibacillus ginsengarvi]RKN86320.1 phytanoyl-CoA dioxygenase family protein [Paenibacillus ginsengarvi]